jgi:aminoglycoside phosphotransferase (APT) family kinase protein
MRRMHADELVIDDRLVRRLVDAQFPEWASFPIERVEPWGTVHAIYRLGDRLSLRLPRRAEWSDEEHLVGRWLPRLAPVLPVAIPVPVAAGRPTDDYPCHWSVCTWIDGESGVDAPWDELAAARDLAAFVAALQRVDPTGGPPRRDRLAERDGEMRAHVARVAGSDALALWEAALAAPAWDGPPVWCHADLDARNWLVRDGRLTGIVDWEAFGVCDPAADVMAAWKLHSPEAARVFREALGVDDATWARARGWAIAQAAMALGYYTLENNAPLVREATLWLELALRGE